MGIASMTGFGTATASAGAESLSIEIRSVNGKFCEVKPRLPRELAALESELVRLVKERLVRGTVDVMVKRSSQGLSQQPKVNGPLLRAYAEALRAAAGSANLGEELSVRDLLGLAGVVELEERPPDLEAATRALQQGLAAALDGVVAVRAREGAALETDLRARLAIIRQHVARLVTAAPAVAVGFRERLKMRVKELAPDLELDPRRLELEVVLIAERSDIAEELTRLAAHLEEFERLLARPGPVGRQLDFLLQEINREANTTGSKSQATELALTVVELKAELERIREQVQNVE